MGAPGAGRGGRGRLMSSDGSEGLHEKTSGTVGGQHVRGDVNRGPCLLLDLLQVAALLPDQPAHQVVVGQDFQKDLLRPAGKHPSREKSHKKRRGSETDVVA